jgi:hypothetical protein
MYVIISSILNANRQREEIKPSVSTAYCGPIQVHDPFHAEAKAVQQEVQWYHQNSQQGNGGAIIITDNRGLVKTIATSDQADIPSWRVVNTVVQIVDTTQASNCHIRVVHASRELVQAAQGRPSYADIIPQDMNIRVLDPGIVCIQQCTLSNLFQEDRGQY